MHLWKQGIIYSQENLSPCPQQSSQTLEKAQLLVLQSILLGHYGSDPYSVTKEPRESKKKEYRDQMLSPVLYNTLLNHSVSVTVAFWDFFLLVKMKLVLQFSSPSPSTGQSCFCVSSFVIFNVTFAYLDPMAPIYFWLDLLGPIPFVSRIIASICYPQSAAFADYAASERVLAYFILSIWRQRLCLPPKLLQCPLRCIQANVCLMFLYSAGYRNREKKILWRKDKN